MTLFCGMQFKCAELYSGVFRPRKGLGLIRGILTTRGLINNTFEIFVITYNSLILNHQFVMFKPPTMFMLIVVVYFNNIYIPAKTRLAWCFPITIKILTNKDHCQ